MQRRHVVPTPLAGETVNGRVATALTHLLHAGSLDKKQHLGVAVVLGDVQTVRRARIADKHLVPVSVRGTVSVLDVNVGVHGMHATNRGLREEMYRAYITRASEGETDNAPIIERVLALRAEKAKLLGYASFAELSMASKVRCVWVVFGFWRCEGCV